MQDFLDLGGLFVCCKIPLKTPSQCEPVQAIHMLLQQAVAGGEASVLGYSQAAEEKKQQFLERGSQYPVQAGLDM